jgi:drug/metabolite transporter (DMT)-like permease
MSRGQFWGVVSTLLASFFLGWAPILGKMAYQRGITPFTLVTFRTVVAAMMLWLIFLIFWRQEIVISWRDILGCVGVGAVNGLGSLLFYAGLSRIDASLASLLNTLYPMWVVLFIFAAGQPVTRLTMVRLGLSTVGVYLLTRTGTRDTDWLGVMLMLASGATYGWHLVLGQWVLADVSARTGALYILTTMACVVGLARIFQGGAVEPISLGGWVTVSALGLTTALSRLAMFSALSLMGGVETALVGLLELLVSLLLAFLVLGERLTPVQLLGGVLLIASLILMTRDPGMSLAEGNVPLEWQQE